MYRNNQKKDREVNGNFKTNATTFTGTVSTGTVIKSIKLTCFIIMPFSGIKYKNKNNKIRDLKKNDLDYIYEEYIIKSIKSYKKNEIEFVKVYRYSRKRGNFTKGIISDLDQADLVIADLTGLNPNVFYELGIRHTIKNGTIMIIQNIKNLPSDLRNYVAFEYEYPDNPAGKENTYKDFEKNMHEAIDDYIEKKNESDNPVKDFLGDRQIFRNEIRINELKRNIELCESIKRDYINNISSMLQCMNDWSRGEKKPLPLINIYLEPFLNRIINTNEPLGFIKFIEYFLTAINLNKHNMPYVKNLLIREKDIEKSREHQFGFYDIKGDFYHLLDLMPYYDYDSGRQIYNFVGGIAEPVYKSIEILKNYWNDELEKISIGKNT